MVCPSNIPTVLFDSTQLMYNPKRMELRHVVDTVPLSKSLPYKCMKQGNKLGVSRLAIEVVDIDTIESS